jgi:hypothetical protein
MIEAGAAAFGSGCKRRLKVRLFLLLPCLTLAGCNVSNNAANESVTIQYNEQQARDTATKAAQTAKNLAAGVGNVAGAAGSAIRNEVGSIDVDIKRTPPQQQPPQQRPPEQKQ